jgi:hypothetical protein
MKVAVPKEHSWESYPSSVDPKTIDFALRPHTQEAARLAL